MDLSEQPLASILGSVLADNRRRVGMTQEKLASTARMDRSYVSDVERGEALVSFGKLFKLCKAMKVPASKIIAEVEEYIGKPGFPRPRLKAHKRSAIT